MTNKMNKNNGRQALMEILRKRSKEAQWHVPEDPGVWDGDPDTWDGVMDVNVRAPFFLVQQAYPLLKAAAKQFKRFRSEATDIKELAPQVGLEPTTLRLTAECSTIELLRSKLVGSPHFTPAAPFRPALR